MLNSFHTCKCTCTGTLGCVARVGRSKKISNPPSQLPLSYFLIILIINYVIILLASATCTVYYEYLSVQVIE